MSFENQLEQRRASQNAGFGKRDNNKLANVILALKKDRKWWTPWELAKRAKGAHIRK